MNRLSIRRMPRLMLPLVLITSVFVLLFLLLGGFGPSQSRQLGHGPEDPVLSYPFTRLNGDSPVYAHLPAPYHPEEKEPGCRLYIPAHLSTQPVVPRPEKLAFSTVASLELLDHPDLKPWYKALGQEQHLVHLKRKTWEWAMGLYVLDKLGMIHSRAKGLSLAAGHEPVHYFLSGKIAMMYAGDMYGIGGFAADGTAAADILSNPGLYAPKGVHWRPQNLKLIWQNARNLSSFATGSLDFVQSFSSIEHFGGSTEAFLGARESLAEQARVVKSGGVVFLTTELILTGQDDKLGNGFNITQLDQAILKPAAEFGLRLMEPVHRGITEATLATGVVVGTYGVPGQVCADSYPHSVVCRRDLLPARLPYSCWVSVALTFTKL